MIKTILFDLDGTLLPMDQDAFTKDYFKRLSAKLIPLGYEPKALVDAIWAGTAAMIKNNGSRTNETAFWDCFFQIYGEESRKDIPAFDAYYRNEFQKVASVCGCNPEAKRTVDHLKEMGYRLSLATNPIFPAVATESRIRWAGLDPSDFEHYTSYENSVHCKPNPDYYRDILNHLNCPAEECLMVGNDVTEDMVAESLGMNVFLLTDCLINKEGKDITKYPRGSFSDLIAWIHTQK